jgi:choloylglycine hydrolase
MKSVRIQGVKLGAEVIGTHVAAVDPSGDSAIFEILDGELVVHHGSEYNVMTNDPSYDWQVTHLAQYQNFGGVREIPGGVEGADRFVRLAHFSHYLPEPRNSEQAAGYALSKRYYFNWTKSPNIVWVDLEKIDFSEGTGKRTLDPKEPGHVGNVSRSFKRLADE